MFPKGKHYDSAKGYDYERIHFPYHTRPTFKTAYCTNALSVLVAAGIENVVRLERTIRYQFNGPIPEDEILLQIAGDQMTGGEPIRSCL
uniref:Peptidase_M28 domain-containing protein n=1 Tax=Angiostrongylus cantonensis TaxID=6313 RepID=A0A0K0D714_ANGCA